MIKNRKQWKRESTAATAKETTQNAGTITLHARS